MDDVVEQRHLVGAGRRVGYLNLEQIASRGPVAVSVLVAGRPAVGHRLGANRPGGAVETRKREAVGAGAVTAHTAAQLAREGRLAARRHRSSASSR